MIGQWEEAETTSVTSEERRGSRKRKADVAVYLQDVDEEVAEMTRKKQRDSELVWSPAAGHRSPHRCILSPHPDNDQSITLKNAGFPLYSFNQIFTTPVHPAPLPALCWASKDMVWSNMLAKDKAYSKDVYVMDKHPHLQPKMRTILLDWLMEVSEVYRLHRETYHLAQDYFDRFMATQRNVFKSTLQLIGITCLFIAAKVEEIYPPKIHQLAYVTDEACTEDEILSMEIIIMKELKWSMSPHTAISWLTVYLQVAYLKEKEDLLIPKFPQVTFTHIAELLDLCMLDVQSLEFSNHILAASALFHFSSLELVENVSALKQAELEECVRWMVPFAMVLRELGGLPLKKFTKIPSEDMHNIQTHAPYVSWLEKASSYKAVDLECHSSCALPSGTLTPPLSSEKYEDLDRVDTTVLSVKPRLSTSLNTPDSQSC